MCDYEVMSGTGRQVYPLGNVTEASPEQVIRKYMPLCRFRSLVQMQALYFRRIDRFDDVWDGKIPLAAWNCGGAELRKWFEGCRETTFVWCSNMDERETLPMWHNYAQDYGVCLVSTVRALTAELSHPRPSSGQEIDGFTLGVVNYIDFKNVDVYTWISEKTDNTTPLFHKQCCYTHEAEFRAVLRPGSATSERARENGNIGVFVPVRLANLIDEIRYFPPADSALEADVRDLARDLSVPFLPAELLNS